MFIETNRIIAMEAMIILTIPEYDNIMNEVLSSEWHFIEDNVSTFSFLCVKHILDIVSTTSGMFDDDDDYDDRNTSTRTVEIFI